MDPDSNLPNHTYPVPTPFLENEITLLKIEKNLGIQGAKGRWTKWSRGFFLSVPRTLPSFIWLKCLWMLARGGEMKRMVTLRYKLAKGERATQHFHYRVTRHFICTVSRTSSSFGSSKDIIQNKILRISHEWQN